MRTMKSHKELISIEEDIVKNQSSMLEILGSSKVYIQDSLSTCIDRVRSEKSAVEFEMKSFTAECIDPIFINRLFSDGDILKFISKYTDSDVNFNKIKKLILAKQGNVEQVKQEIVEPSYVPQVEQENKSLSVSNKKSGYVSNDVFSELMGRPVFKYDDALCMTSDRERTKSEVYSARFSSNSDSYRVQYKKDDEVENVFTLFDYLSGKKFINKNNQEETLATLGVNIISFYGFPNSDGSVVTERSKTDLISVGDYFKMEQCDITKTYNSKYVSNYAFLRGFMTGLVNLGYGDILYDFFSGLINIAKKQRASDNIFEKFYFSDKLNYRKDIQFLYVSGYGYICFSREMKISKAFIFAVMEMALKSVICFKHEKLDPEELAKTIKFYGGHDFVAQGDDLNNFFNTEKGIVGVVSQEKPSELNNFLTTTDKEKSVTTGTSSGLKTKGISQEPVEGLKYIPYTKCIKDCGASNRPVSIRLSINGNSHVVNANSLVRDMQKEKNEFGAIDVILSVMEILLEEGYSFEEICKCNTFVISMRNISSVPHKSKAHIDLGNSKYYVINKNVSWDKAGVSLDRLFESLKIKKSSLEFSFEK